MLNLDQTPRDENGLPHGEWVTYYHNELEVYKRNFIHGVLHGFYEGIHKRNVLYCRGYYKMDIPIGYWLFENEKRYYLCLI